VRDAKPAVDMSIVISDAESAKGGVGTFTLKRRVGERSHDVAADRQDDRFERASGGLPRCNGAHMPGLPIMFDKSGVIAVGTFREFDLGHGSDERWSRSTPALQNACAGAAAETNDHPKCAGDRLTRGRREMHDVDWMSEGLAFGNLNKYAVFDHCCCELRECVVAEVGDAVEVRLIKHWPEQPDAAWNLRTRVRVKPAIDKDKPRLGAVNVECRERFGVRGNHRTWMPSRFSCSLQIAVPKRVVVLGGPSKFMHAIACCASLITH